MRPIADIVAVILLESLVPECHISGSCARTFSVPPRTIALRKVMLLNVRHGYMTITIQSIDTDFMRPLSASFPFLFGIL